MLQNLRMSILLGWLAATAGAQTITTVAGTNWSFPSAPLPALQAPLGFVSSVTVDTAGNYYITDVSNYQVFKVDSSGTLSIVAGNGTWGYSGPGGITVDTAGNLFIADTDNCRVRKVDTNGIITTGGTGRAVGRRAYCPASVRSVRVPAPRFHPARAETRSPASISNRP